MGDDDEQLHELTERASELGFKIVHDHTWGYIVYRPGRPLTPQNYSNRDLDEVREMLAGIEWGREHGTAEA